MANSRSMSNILVPQPSISEKESKKWKYVGYRGASRWMASEDDFFMVRRFATLNTRVLLTKEAQIADLERRLEEKDLVKAPPGAREYDNSTVLEDFTPDRQALLSTLWRELKDYNEFVIAHSTLRARPSATEFELHNKNEWLKENEGAICDEEAMLYGNNDDLIAITTKFRTPLRRYLERSTWILKLWPFKKSRPSTLTNQDLFAGSVYFSDEDLDRFVYGVIIALGLLMLLAPLWWLNYVSDTTKQLGIITGFLVFFVFLLSRATGAKPLETMAATAGYAAVLMVFLQLSASGNTSNNATSGFSCTGFNYTGSGYMAYNCTALQ